MGAWTTTREAVKSAPESDFTARSDARVDAAIDSASRGVESLLRRTFYPWTGTRYFDYPPTDGPVDKLWLGRNDVLSISSLVSGGVTIPPSGYLLWPYDGPPYIRLDINRGSSSAFGAGTTPQRAIAITGVFGYSLDEKTAGALAEALDAVETEVQISDASLVDVGHILRVDSERMIVTGRGTLTSGQTLQSPLTASNAGVSVAVTTGSAFHAGEVILLDGERMLIVDIAGNTLIVKRAWDGSTLAAHTSPTIYTYRSLTVERGALGTTAAAHADTTPMVRHVIPPLIETFTRSLATLDLVGQQHGRDSEIVTRRHVSMRTLREECRSAHGRMLMGAV